MVTLKRQTSNAHCTFGRLTVNGYSCVTMEPPWRHNMVNKSCIPAGSYTCHWMRSPKYGWTYGVFDVEGRSSILIHPGNLARHTKGCILPGRKVGNLGGLPAVLSSRTATRNLFKHLPKTFQLEVTDA